MATVANTPHFDLPFHYEGFKPAVVEQDSIYDVRNCVEASLRTELGFRDSVPDFGITDITFSEQPIATDQVIAEVLDDEPRAEILMEQDMDILDNLIVKITTEVEQINE